MAQNGKGLGWQYDYGGIWSIWSDGATLAASAGDHIEVGQGQRCGGTLATRYGAEM